MTHTRVSLFVLTSFLTRCTQAAGASGAPAAAEAPLESHRLGFGAPGVGESRATAHAPWYARPECSLLAPRADDSDALPARVRRERAELAQLRASGAQGGGRPDPATKRLALMPPQHAAPAPAAAKPKAGGKRSVEELRAERTAREAAERRREAALMAAARGSRQLTRPSAGAPRRLLLHSSAPAARRCRVTPPPSIPQTTSSFWNGPVPFF
jgi:hypothetical protein